MNRFHDSWMEEDALKDWLVKVSNDESRAYCRWCAVVLRAHKTDLTNHSNSLKHVANAKTAAETGSTSTGPITVQIVCNDNNDEEGGSGDVPSAEKKPKQQRLSGYAGYGKTNYRKKYRECWENDPELSDWVSPYPRDDSKAFCKRCGVTLRAHKHDLVLHGRSVRHQNNSGVGVRSLVEVEMDQGENSSFNTAKSDDVMDADDIVESIIGFEGNDSNDGEGEKEPEDPADVKTFASPVVKKTIPMKATARPFSYTPRINHPPKKRYNINAADVVAAIKNNEFTGYELLQIVKVSVPKL